VEGTLFRWEGARLGWEGGKEHNWCGGRGMQLRYTVQAGRCMAQMGGGKVQSPDWTVHCSGEMEHGLGGRVHSSGGKVQSLGGA
jgi:hypothetical protein